jgi:hypothetical protein
VKSPERPSLPAKTRLLQIRKSFPDPVPFPFGDRGGLSGGDAARVIGEPL